MFTVPIFNCAISLSWRQVTHDFRPMSTQLSCVWRTTTSQADMHNIYTILRCSWKVSRSFNNKLEPIWFKLTCLLINKASVVSAIHAPNINSIWHHFRRPLQWILQNRLTEMSNSLQNKKCSVFCYRKFSTTHAYHLSNRFRYVLTYYMYVHASF